MEVLSLLPVLPATVVGYYTCKAISHPTSRIRRKLPNIKLKRLELSPVIRIRTSGKIIHLHHWFNFSLLLASTAFMNAGILETIVARGLLLGGIIQGLTFPRGHRKVIACTCSHCNN